LEEGEVAKPVERFNGLIFATNFGRIYSMPRKVKKFCFLQNKVVEQNYGGKFLKQYLRNGYPSVRFGIDGQKYGELVSRLVLEAFAGPKTGMFACHNDSNTLNNHVSNLRWDSQKGNMRDRTERGFYKKGSEHHEAKIPQSLVDDLILGKVQAKDAAKQHGFAYSHLWRIATGKSWKHRHEELKCLR
jgi:hypothetical protein